MEHDEFRALLKELGISQRQFARDIDDTDVTIVNRWATGKARIPGAASAYLRLRVKLHRISRGDG
jgi:DNA-binding transcriptional regulator YiaG